MVAIEHYRLTIELFLKCRLITKEPSNQSRVFTGITRSTKQYSKPYCQVTKAVFSFNFILQFETKPTSPYYRSSVHLTVLLEEIRWKKRST